MATTGSNGKANGKATRTLPLSTPASPAQRGINFNDALRRERIPFTIGEETFELRDDVSSEVIIRIAMADVLNQRWAEVTKQLDEEHATVAEIRRAITEVLGEVQAEWREIVSAIFRHTYPDWTEEDTAKRFTWDQQQEIGRLFFTRRTRGSQPPASATSAPSETADEEQPPALMTRGPR